MKVFNIELALELIALAGTILVLGCQLYLWAHLLELRRVLSDLSVCDWPTGFIGLYPDRWVRFVFNLSLVGLPQAALGSTYLLLTIRSGLTQTLNLLRLSLFFAAFAVSLILGAKSVRLLAQLANTRKAPRPKEQGPNATTTCA